MDDEIQVTGQVMRTPTSARKSGESITRTQFTPTDTKGHSGTYDSIKR